MPAVSEEFTNANMTEHLHQRVDSVERNLDGLREANAHTQAALSSLRTESAAHTRDLHDIKEAITNSQDRQKTDWQVVATMGGLGVLILSLCFAPVYMVGSHMVGELEKDSDRDLENSYQMGYRDAELLAMREQLLLLEKERHGDVE